MRDMDDQCLFYSWNMERDMRLKEMMVEDRMKEIRRSVIRSILN